MSRYIYVVETQAHNGTIFVSIPENVTQDVAGNKNMASNFNMCTTVENNLK